MTTEKLTEIKNKIDVLKTKQIQIQTKKQSILDTWKKEYNINTVGEAEDLLKSTKKKMNTLEEKSTKLSIELEEILAGVE